MNEVNAMSDQTLIQKTREFENEVKKIKYQITRANQEIKDLDARIKENKDKLNLSTTLPHMVANVGEILDPEEDEDEKDTTGFQQETSQQKNKKAIVVK